MNTVSRRQDAVLIGLALAGVLPATLAELTSDLLNAHFAYAFLGSAVLAGVVAVARPSRERGGGLRWVLTRALVLTALGYATLEISILRQVPVIALGHFVTVLCAAKFLDLNEDGDRMVIVIIALLLMVIGAMVSGSVVFGLVLMLYLTVGVHWLIAFRMGIDAQAAWQSTVARLVAGGRRHVGLPPRGMAFRPQIWTISLAYGAVVLVVVILIFLVVPRDLIRARIPLGVPPSLSGFSAEVGLSDLRPIIESDQPVLRVRLRREGRIVGGEDRPLYLRGVTLDQDRSGRRFRARERHSFDVQLLHQSGSRVLSEWAGTLKPSNRLEMEVWLDRMTEEEPYLFTLYPPAAIACPDIDQLQFDRTDRTLKIDRGLKSSLYYRVLLPDRVDAALVAAIEDEARNAELEWGSDANAFTWPPPGDRSRRPRSATLPNTVTELARRIVGTTQGTIPPDGQAAAAAAIERYLQSNRYRYTLSPKSLNGSRSPIETFLLDTREGYCQHFASAMTVLCQCVGIEVRMVLGYLGTEYNAVGQFYRVRKRDAHAWVEVHLPDRGWITFDPTPLGPDATRQRRDPWLAAMSKWYDYLQFQWASIVVTFDSEHRRDLLAVLTQWWKQSAEPGRERQSWFTTLGQLLYGPPVFTPFQRAMYWLCAALIITLALLVLRALWVVSLIIREHMPRRRRGQSAAPRHPPARFYDRLIVLLDRRGMSKPHAMTPREFAETVVAAHPELAPVRQLTDWFYLTQYGRRELPPDVRLTIGRWLENLRHYGRFDVGGSPRSPTP